MSWYSTLYWLTRVESLNTALGVICVTTLIGSIFGILFYLCAAGDNEELNPLLIKFRRIVIPVCIISNILWALVPSRKDLLTIVVGGTVFNYVEKDSSLQQIPYELSSFMKEQIKSWKDELSDKKKLEDMTKEELIEYTKSLQQ